ncbi:hypothetical protein CH75_07515 [Dyella jiangningensis]|nr:hypothetical protein CH75_07515 [Dyella jiangningensis]
MDGGLWLLCELEGTPKTACGASTGSSAWRSPSTIIHTHPASEARKIATPSQTIGCWYQAEGLAW